MRGEHAGQRLGGSHEGGGARPATGGQRCSQLPPPEAPPHNPKALTMASALPSKGGAAARSHSQASASTDVQPSSASGAGSCGTSRTPHCARGHVVGSSRSGGRCEVDGRLPKRRSHTCGRAGQAGRARVAAEAAEPHLLRKRDHWSQPAGPGTPSAPSCSCRGRQGLQRTVPQVDSAAASAAAAATGSQACTGWRLRKHAGRCPVTTRRTSLASSTASLYFCAGVGRRVSTADLGSAAARMAACAPALVKSERRGAGDAPGSSWPPSPRS